MRILQGVPKEILGGGSANNDHEQLADVAYIHVQGATEAVWGAVGRGCKPLLPGGQPRPLVVTYITHL